MPVEHQFSSAGFHSAVSQPMVAQKQSPFEPWQISDLDKQSNSKKVYNMFDNCKEIQNSKQFVTLIQQQPVQVQSTQSKNDRTLFVYYLVDGMSTLDVRKHFQRYGPVEEVKIFLIIIINKF